MSSHFKYEIDERNLRLQLKENELSFTEEAWQRFESFSASQKNTVSDVMIKRFHVSLNRNVVLPIVFATVIILFSLLLFNFINIKNPTRENVEVPVPEQATAGAAGTEVKPPVTLAVQASSVNTGLSNATTPPQADAEIPEHSGVSSAEDNQLVKTIASTETPAGLKSESAPREQKDGAMSVGHNAGTGTPGSSEELSIKKKRRVKRELIVTEPTQEEAEQLPPPPVSQTPSGESPQ